MHLVDCLHLRLRQVFKRAGLKLVAESNRFELGIVESECCSSCQCERNGPTTWNRPGLGYESGGYVPFFIVIFLTSSLAASTNLSDAAGVTVRFLWRSAGRIRTMMRRLDRRGADIICEREWDDM